uniref:Pseudouridine-5'-monophosphatase (inferred by orthology to a human protein) n=1 Tax=Strongyloides venezuelensis TaxID=75913 RepID=A0A0K0G2D3_STRVS
MLYRPKITHVIFDLDGTLLDSEEIYTKANKETLEKFGVDGNLFTVSIKFGMAGKKQQEAIKFLLQKLELSDKITIEDYKKCYDESLEELLPTAKLLPGAVEIVEYFKKNNIPLAISTGSNECEFKLKTKNHQELIRNFETIVLCGSDPEVRFGKPHPDAFIVTMNRFSRIPESPMNCLVFEDAPNGVYAGVSARCQVIMIPQYEDSQIEDAKKKATKVLGSLSEFDPAEFMLPPM